MGWVSDLENTHEQNCGENLRSDPEKLRSEGGLPSQRVTLGQERYCSELNDTLFGLAPSNAQLHKSKID